MNFAKFYNNQKDYKQFRRNPEKRKEYQTWVNWKVDNLINVIPDNVHFSNVLEIGCAFGLLLNCISEKLKISDVYGIDISSDNIKLAKELFPHITFFTGTLNQKKSEMLTNLKTKKFDLIILSDILEHVPDDLKLLRQVSQISKFVLIKLPLEKCFVTRNRIYGENDPSGHLRMYDEEDGLNLVKEAGLKIINKRVKIALRNHEGYKVWKKEQNIRISQKSFLKKIFWKNFYNFQDMLLIHFPAIYKRIYGSNLFFSVESSF
jgi:predicted TPR repeat methyltransferase